MRRFFSFCEEKLSYKDILWDVYSSSTKTRLVKLDQLNMRGILSVTAWSSAGENSTFEIAYVLAPGWQKCEIR